MERTLFKVKVSMRLTGEDLATRPLILSHGKRKKIQVFTRLCVIICDTYEYKNKTGSAYFNSLILLYKITRNNEAGCIVCEE